MVRGALKSKKTPRQFLPSLRKRLARLTAAVAILFVLCGCSVQPGAAQTPVIIQPTQQQLATNTLCTGLTQTFPVNNKNQTQHYASIKSTTATNMQVQIYGVDSAGNSFLISETATIGTAIVGSSPVLTGSGYYPTIKVVVTCLPTSATFTLSYSGSSAINNIDAGGYQLAQIDKQIAVGAPGATTISTVFQAPFGDSLGTITFVYGGGVGPAGSSLQILCQASDGNAVGGFSYTLAAAGGAQIFNVPDLACPNVSLGYVAGGATATTISMDYVFVQPGFKLSNSYAHIAGTTATEVKPGTGVVNNLVVGTPAAGTITLFDLIPGSCTGTPATNVVSVLTVTTSTQAPIPYGVTFNNGICIKASAVMDITVGYQ